MDFLNNNADYEDYTDVVFKDLNNLTGYFENAYTYKYDFDKIYKKMKNYRCKENDFMFRLMDEPSKIKVEDFFEFIYKLKKYKNSFDDAIYFKYSIICYFKIFDFK